MTDRSVIQASFVVEHSFAVPPAQVFKAFTDPAAKAAWFRGPPDWEKGEATLDFREGGREVSVGGPKGGPKHAYEARFHDIVPNERIVSTYEMRLGDARLSTSLVTTEFKPQGAGTLVVYTEHAAFLDGHDDSPSREGGTQWLFQALDAYLQSVPA